MRPGFMFCDMRAFHRRDPRDGHGPFRRGFGGRGRGGMGGFSEGDMAMTRMLAHGDLRLLVLLLIEEAPRHGYELIKLIETKSSEQYSPSPGVIYPTLTYLEETGMVATTTQGEKKQYKITPEGTGYLEESRAVAQEILQRLEEVGAQRALAKKEAMNQDSDVFGGAGILEIRNAFRALKIELRSNLAKTTEKKKQILDILQRALTEIKSLK